MRALVAVCLLLLCGAAPAPCQANGTVLGYWREPAGSVIHVEPCGTAVCATLVAISADAPSRTDSRNPDLTRRGAPLCGLRIGRDYKGSGTAKAEDGLLYDPKTGKTYRGSMTAEKDVLHLRGYVGLPLFGKTENWARVPAVVPPCVR